MRKGDAGFISVRFPVTASNIENTPSAVWSALVCFLRDENVSKLSSLDRRTLSRSLFLHAFWLTQASWANTAFIYFIYETLEDYRKSWFLARVTLLDLYTVVKTAVNYPIIHIRSCLKFIYRVYELHLRSRNTSYAISPRAGRYFRQGNIQLRVSVFSNPILVTC